MEIVTLIMFLPPEDLRETTVGFGALLLSNF